MGPGLGLGYGTEGAGGYNSGNMMRESWLPKTVDDLRTANKQKASEVMQLGHEGPAKSRITNVGILGAFQKNRPETAFEWGHDRLFTTTGIAKGETLHSIPIERHVVRPETTVDYNGVAQSLHAQQAMPGEILPSHRTENGPTQLGAANAVGRGFSSEGDYGLKSKQVYANNRSSNVQEDYFGAIGSSIGAVVAPLLEIMRPSRKENTTGNLRVYGDAKTAVSVTPSQQFKVEATLKDIALDYARGYFGNQVFTDTTALPVDYLNNIVSGLIDVNNIQLNLSLSNGMKVPVKSELSLIENVNNMGNTVSLSAPCIGQDVYLAPATGSWNNLTPSVQQLQINSQNSNVEQVFENLGAILNLGTIYAKTGATIVMSGGIHVIYHEPGVNLVMNGGIPTLYPCPSLVFNYSQAPANGCAPVPVCNLTASTTISNIDCNGQASGSSCCNINHIART